jgi:hypothetical protein
LKVFTVLHTNDSTDSRCSLSHSIPVPKAHREIAPAYTFGPVHGRMVYSPRLGAGALSHPKAVHPLPPARNIMKRGNIMSGSHLADETFPRGGYMTLPKD